MNSSERFIVEHRPTDREYALIDRGEAGDGTLKIGEESYVDVVTDAGTQRVMYHTGVSEEYGGQGLAAVLVRFAVDDTIAAGHKFVPVCPYVAAWAKKHPEVSEHVVERGPEHLRAINSL